MTAPIVLVEYDPAWPARFAELRSALLIGLGDLAPEVEHIGSTAVPGLAAKPIIDLEVVVHLAADLAPAIARLATLGYAHEGELVAPGYHAFDWPRALPRHHLYACAADHPAHHRHIRFRDHLRAHPEDVAAYAALKLRLAAARHHDRAAYTEGKGAFVAEILARTRR